MADGLPRLQQFIVCSSNALAEERTIEVETVRLVLHCTVGLFAQTILESVGLC